MEFIGRTLDINEDCQWGSIKLHKAVVMQVCPLLWTMMANVPEFEAKVVFPDFPLEVIKAFVDLIYHGECKLSAKCDVYAIMSLSHTLGLMIPPDRFQVKEVKVEVKNLSPGKPASVKVPVSIQLPGVDLNHNEGLPEMITDKYEGINDLSGFDFEVQANDEIVETIEEVIKMTLTCVMEKDSTADVLEHNSKQEAQCPSIPQKNSNSVQIPVMDKTCVNKSKKVESSMRFSCQHCQFRCKFYVTLIEHCNSMHPNSTFSCDKCSFKTSKVVQLRAHKKAVHLGKGDIVCDYCGFRALDDNKLESHVRYLHTPKTESKVKKRFRLVGSKKLDDFTSWKSEGSRKSLRCRSLQMNEALECSFCEFSTVDFEALQEHSHTCH